MPNELSSAQPKDMAFIIDSSGIMILLASPDVHVVGFYFDKKSTMIHQRICRVDAEHMDCDIQLACHMRDPLIFAVGGNFS